LSQEEDEEEEEEEDCWKEFVLQQILSFHFVNKISSLVTNYNYTTATTDSTDYNGIRNTSCSK
jgi:hypothetical protein